MKLSTLTLSVLSAILLSACGGSSSNDNAVVDNNHQTPVKPVPKNTTPDTDDTAQKNTPVMPKKTTPDSTTTTITPTTTTPTKTTPIVPEPDAKTKIAELTRKGKQLNKEKKTLINTRNKAQGDLTTALAKINDQSIKNKAPWIAKANEAQKEVDELNDKLNKNEIESLQNSAMTAGVKAEAATTNVENLKAQGKDTVAAQKKADTLLLDAKQKFTQAELAKTGIAFQDKQNEIRDLKAQQNEIEKPLKDLQAEIRKSGSKATAAQQQKLEKFEKKFEKEHGAELKVLTAKIEAAEKELKTLKEAKEEALQEDNIALSQSVNNKIKNMTNGVRFSAAPNSTFGEVYSADKNEEGWTLKFTAEKDEKSVETKYAKGPKGLKSFDNTSYGTFQTIDKKTLATKAFDNSAFGFVDGQLYSVGNLSSKVPEPQDLAKLNSADYTGTAFFIVDKKARQVANFTGRADFNVGRTFSGKFDHFQAYKNGAAFQTLTSKKSKMPAITFTAPIDKKNYSFQSAADAKTQVSGFFYGENAAEVGGLVRAQVDKHTFEGAFGGKKPETAPATTHQ